MSADVRRLIAGAALAFTGAGMAYAAFSIAQMRRFRARMAEPPPRFMPPITILKPLRGNEIGLYENLRSFCDQRYARYQVIFGAADANDPALEVARAVQREHPQTDVKIVGGRAVPSNNPKIGNLLGTIAHAKYELLVVADSDVRVGPGYLAAVAACFIDPNVGAATCTYGGTPTGGVPSQLGAMFVNEHFSPSVLVASALEPLSYCFGATMAVRKDVLERVGGLGALSDRLGDDYFLGKLVAAQGWIVDLCPYVVRTSIAERDLKSLWLRELRWARTIRAQRPVGYAGSIVTYVLPFAWLFALATRSRTLGWAVAVTASVLRLAVQFQALKTFGPELHAAPWLIPVRDALGVGVWCASFAGRNVTWQQALYSVNAGGEIVVPPGNCNDSVYR